MFRSEASIYSFCVQCSLLLQHEILKKLVTYIVFSYYLVSLLNESSQDAFLSGGGDLQPTDFCLDLKFIWFVSSSLTWLMITITWSSAKKQDMFTHTGNGSGNHDTCMIIPITWHLEKVLFRRRGTLQQTLWQWSSGKNKVCLQWLPRNWLFFTTFYGRYFISITHKDSRLSRLSTRFSLVGPLRLRLVSLIKV